MKLKSGFNYLHIIINLPQHFCTVLDFCVCITMILLTALRLLSFCCVFGLEMITNIHNKPSSLCFYAALILIQSGK